jgi:hypothetical protein
MHLSVVCSFQRAVVVSVSGECLCWWSVGSVGGAGGGGDTVMSVELFRG